MQLKTARKIARLTQHQLADLADSEPATLAAIEDGTTPVARVPYELAVRLARALHVDAPDLFPIDDPQGAAEQLRIARRIAGLNQTQLAALADVDNSVISFLETGKRSVANVAYESVVRLARALHVEPQELFPVGYPMDAEGSAPAGNAP
jgi:transcriptional regulator with XRE-family HTH domain